MRRQYAKPKSFGRFVETNAGGRASNVTRPDRLHARGSHSRRTGRYFRPVGPRVRSEFRDRRPTDENRFGNDRPVDIRTDGRIFRAGHQTNRSVYGRFSRPGVVFPVIIKFAFNRTGISRPTIPCPATKSTRHAANKRPNENAAASAAAAAARATRPDTCASRISFQFPPQPPARRAFQRLRSVSAFVRHSSVA